MPPVVRSAISAISSTMLKRRVLELGERLEQEIAARVAAEELSARRRRGAGR